MARPEPVLPPGTDLVELLVDYAPEDRVRAVRQLGLEHSESLDADWRSWAHGGQLPPETCPNGAPWSVWVLMAGRGFGKTRAGAQWIVDAVAAAGTVTGNCPQLSIALVGATLDEARSVMVEGRSGLLAVADTWVRDWNPSLRRLTFTTGATATLFSGASPEQLRGPEHHFAWCDELAKWEKPGETWDMLQLGLRLGALPRALVTTTPRPGPHLQRIMDEPGTAVTHGTSWANPHISDAWKRAAAARYAGTRLARQELDGEMLTDTPGALWNVELLERCRLKSGESNTFTREGVSAKPSPLMGEGWVGVESPEPLGGSHSPPHPMNRFGSPRDPKPSPGEMATCSSLPIEGRENLVPDESNTFIRPHFVRIVIGVDPPTVDGTCGIVACAKDADGHAHILADHSVTARTPEGWSAAVAAAAYMWAGLHPAAPVRIVAESNQGGEMVRAVLRTADPGLRVKLVTAKKSKTERAEPVSMLFAAGKVTLHGRFRELEAELRGMIAGGDYEGPGASPDRADAMVWGLTELMLKPDRPPPRVTRL